jgi:hypothetical protein
MQVCGLVFMQSQPLPHTCVWNLLSVRSPSHGYLKHSQCNHNTQVTVEANLLTSRAHLRCCIAVCSLLQTINVVQVWHNYSFDKHILQRHGLGISPDTLQKHGQDPSQLTLKLAGFAADTMHMARLHDAVRKATKSYSLASLTSDKTIMSSPGCSVIARSKVSMKEIFSVPKMTKTGKLSASLRLLPAIHEIQVCMHACCLSFDSLSTLGLGQDMICTALLRVLGLI